MPKQSPSQTVGPFFSYALTPESYGYEGPVWDQVFGPDAEGERITIEGVVRDGAGDPVPDAMIEIWQADGEGKFHDGPAGFGRSGTDPTGRFRFCTVKPGPTRGQAAPHISVAVFARGMLLHAFTRIYFADESVANENDAVLHSVDPGRRTTLIADRVETPAGPVYEFPLRLQGDRETIFFDA